MTDSSILKPGVNCWKIEQADRATFLIDGEAYFSAFYHAVERAQRPIFILCWDISIPG